MNVVVGIVTYANRFDLMKQVIDAALTQGVNKIVVIDNNSIEESREKIKKLECELNGKLIVKYLDENYGSAVGFYNAIYEAKKITNGFIYLLDDDNVPENGAINNMLAFYAEKNLDLNKDMCCSLRGKQDDYVRNNDMTLFEEKRNGFIGFDFFSFIKNKCFKPHKQKNNHPYINVASAAYGGMFFHKSLIDQIGYPNVDFFLYTDDTDFSYRVIQNKGNIYALFDSKIIDVDQSWWVKPKKKRFSIPILADETPDFRIYYSIRNTVYMEYRTFVTSRCRYFFNMFIYMMRLFIYALISFQFKKLPLIIKAICDGIKGKLGKVDLNEKK